MKRRYESQIPQKTANDALTSLQQMWWDLWGGDEDKQWSPDTIELVAASVQDFFSAHPEWKPREDEVTYKEEE